MKHNEPPPTGVSRETSSIDSAWWSPEQFDAVASYLGLSIGADAYLRFERFAEWLTGEAEQAGGIGPAEHLRLFDRHIADSLMYVKALPRSVTSVVDIGSGVGLPGIPLAVALPEVEVTLVDRSAKRTGLARRCVRLLGLTNVKVLTTTSDQVTGAFDAAVFRASLPIPFAAKAFVRTTTGSGVGVVGVSRRHDTPVIPDAEDGLTFGLEDYGNEVLDSPFWLLRMTRSGS